MERGCPGSIRRRATRAQGSATRTLAAGHAHLGEAPIDAGECDAVGRHPQPWSRDFPAQAPSSAEAATTVLPLIEMITR